jgi:hypothetical protein
VRACGRRRHVSGGGAVALLAALGCLPRAAAAQIVQTPEGTSVWIGGSGSRYEDAYGRPRYCALDNDEAWPCHDPASRSLRTAGTLQEIPQSREAVGPGSVANPRYRICRGSRCLDVAPVEELAEVFLAHFPFWVWHEVEVVGAWGAGEQGRSASGAFRIWEAALLPERSAGTGAGSSSLEPLVRSPSVWAGRTVTVAGRFRGANLFGDLQPESRRSARDWVLRDGPFSVWVTGRPPRGTGWSLDPASPADCRFRLRVEGRVETRHGYVYLRAKSVSLLGRAPRNDRDAPEADRSTP